MVKVETVVNWIHNGHKNRLFKSRRSPTRVYYISNNKRVYVESPDITPAILNKIEFQKIPIRKKED